MNYEERTTAIEAAEAGINQHSRPEKEVRAKEDFANGRSNKESRMKRFAERTKLNTSYANILAECANAEFRDVRPPEPLVLKNGQRPSKKYCRYHKSNGHDTNNCMALKDDVEALIRRGKLTQYVKRDHMEARDDRKIARSPRRGKAADETIKVVEEDDEEDIVDVRKSKGRPVAMVISGGTPTDASTNRSIKRRFDEIMSVASTSALRPTSERPSISFGDEDLIDGTPNYEVPLVIVAVMANMEVRRILVDQGSSADIIFEDLLDVLKISKDDLRPYRGTVLTGFNGASTTPIGRLELMVTFGDDTVEDSLCRTVRTDFIVLPCKSVYQCIIGRPTLARLEAIPSTVHLKMKFYTKSGLVATIPADLLSAKRAFLLGLKEKGKKVAREIEAAMKGGEQVNLAELDARYDPDSEEEEGDDLLTRELKNRIKRPEPDGEFCHVQLGDDPKKTIKIGKDLSNEIHAELVHCLKDHADLFAWSAADMPGIPPQVACHHLAVNPEAKWVAQRRRVQKEEKARAASKAVEDLLEAGFIKEIKYTTWLSNVVLVKKANGNWRMCVDYTDLNRACPKDAFPVPSVDRLVDNASGYKILSFLDAYSGYNQIAMHPPDQEKTAFMTDKGNFCYKVMPFGLKNAGATYQRMMNQVFHGQIGKMVEVYLDDMIIKSKQDRAHIDDLREVFKEARKNSLRFNPEKCTFGVRAGKFLGFCLTERGIEANPDKCRAVTEMRPPTTKKEIQKLNGMIAALSRFVSKAANKSLPLFRLLKKEIAFEWTPECDLALGQLKTALAEPPILTTPKPGETLYLYLSITDEALAAVLVREEGAKQNPVYFVSKVLQGPELRYQKIEKLAFALVVSARRLRPYFVAHQVTLRTDQPIRQILHRPDLAGRMIKWAVELSEFGIKYEPRSTIKGQVLADFIAELTAGTSEPVHDLWTLHVDGSSNTKGSGAGLILENEQGTTIEVSLTLSFPTTNNQAEYEACLAGLMLALEFNVRKVELCSDSLLAVSQIKDIFLAKDEILQRYLAKVKEMMQKFEYAEVRHVPRAENARADILSKLASTKKNDNHRSVIQKILSQPSVKLEPILGADVCQVDLAGTWIDPIFNYIRDGEEPVDPKEAALVRKRATSYSIINGQLYRRGFTMPLLKCLLPAEANYVLKEIHEGICGNHMGSRALAKKALRAGYYWPTIDADAKDLVKKCDKCQRHGDVHVAPPTELNSLTAPWPFSWWGVDLLGPFSLAPGQLKFLIVAVDYFTKWIEAEPLATITSRNCLKFVKRNILVRFGIPEVVVSDNGTQFTDHNFQETLAELGVKQRFTSVEHPQTNGQAEAANRVILRGLKRRLDEAKGKWAEELPSVLWAYRTTPHSTTGESPFRMVYGTDALIPVEMGELNWRTTNPLQPTENEQATREELDLVEELRSKAALREALVKQKMAIRHNTKVVPRSFEVGQLVLRRADIGQRNARQGKLAPNWEGPYRVAAKTGKGAYILQTMTGGTIANTWNVTNLRRYFT